MSLQKRGGGGIAPELGPASSLFVTCGARASLLAWQLCLSADVPVGAPFPRDKIGPWGALFARPAHRSPTRDTPGVRRGGKRRTRSFPSTHYDSDGESHSSQAF